ncbi:MAG: hypothetical protein AB1758_19040, partial [Candidatus Eremiobacterota bacterium]
GDTWVRGGVPGSDLGLRQAGDIRIHADTNNDGIIQANERLGSDLNGDGLADGERVGAGWGIQFHPGGSGQNVGSWSAGCQVIRPEDYGRFQQVLRNATNTRFSYTLVDGANLPAVDPSQAAPPGSFPSTPAPPPPAIDNSGGAVPPVPGGPTGQTPPSGVPYNPAQPVPGQAQLDNLFGNQAPYQNGGVHGMLDQKPNTMFDQVLAMAEQEVRSGRPGPYVQLLQMLYYQAMMTGVNLKPELQARVQQVLSQAGAGVFQGMFQQFPGGLPFGPPPMRLPTGGLRL